MTARATAATRAWVQGLGLMMDAGLRGLAATCPTCGKRGVVLSKWTKGNGNNRLCVYHRNGTTAPLECVVPPEHASGLRARGRLLPGDVRRLAAVAAPYVLFSGGDDSLCTLMYVQGLLRDSGVELQAIHVDTTAGFPEVTEYAREVCRLLGVPLTVVGPGRDYFELAMRWGIPGHNARWCCHELKVKPVRDFMRNAPQPSMVIDGIRAAESTQRSRYLPLWYHPEFRCLSASPIIDWSNAKVRSYLKRSDIPESPAKSLGCSAECWCGAYKKRSDFEKLLDVHPEIFDKLVRVEEAQRGRFTFVYENGRRVPLEELRADGAE